MFVWFVQLNESKQFWGIFFGKYFDITWKTQNSVFVENCSMWEHIFYITVTRNETAARQVKYNSSLGIKYFNPLMAGCNKSIDWFLYDGNFGV